MSADMQQVVDLLTQIRDNTRPVTLDLMPPVHSRDVTDRLKAAEQCVLAIVEAVTGEKHDGIYDYDQVREHVLSTIQERSFATGGPVSAVPPLPGESGCCMFDLPRASVS